MKAAQRDFLAYLHWDEIGRDMNPFGDPTVSEGDHTALAAFIARDSRGENLGTKQPLLLRSALRGKMALNLQIKMWAEWVGDGIRAGGIFVPTALQELREIREEFRFLPAWVWQAVWNQAGGDRAVII